MVTLCGTISDQNGKFGLQSWQPAAPTLPAGSPGPVSTSTQKVRQSKPLCLVILLKNIDRKSPSESSPVPAQNSTKIPLNFFFSMTISIHTFSFYIFFIVKTCLFPFFFFLQYIYFRKGFLVVYFLALFRILIKIIRIWIGLTRIRILSRPKIFELISFFENPKVNFL